tara:strand:+ start:104 stop:235 length:132 start_codon:yes stop_codon:yes gene_type:complete
MPKQANRILLGNLSNLAGRRGSSKASILRIDVSSQNIDVRGLF